MANENGEWVMRALRADDPGAIRTPEELLEYINRVGLLPLFANGVHNFSVEELTIANHWWGNDPEKDPWEWRKVLSKSGKVAYGKFFAGKAGYVSLEMFPHFVNYRRDGYDFDALWSDGKAQSKCKAVMDLFESEDELLSFQIKNSLSHIYKNTESAIGMLQMQTYLCIKDFRQRMNKKGESYGWGIGLLSTPEKIFGYDFVRSEYKTDPKESFEILLKKVKETHPDTDENIIIKLIR